MFDRARKDKSPCWLTKIDFRPTILLRYDIVVILDDAHEYFTVYQFYVQFVSNIEPIVLLPFISNNAFTYSKWIVRVFSPQSNCFFLFSIHKDDRFLTFPVHIFIINVLETLMAAWCNLIFFIKQFFDPCIVEGLFRHVFCKLCTKLCWSYWYWCENSIVLSDSLLSNLKENDRALCHQCVGSQSSKYSNKDWGKS